MGSVNTTRGNARQRFVRDNRDREVWLWVLGQAVSRCGPFDLPLSVKGKMSALFDDVNETERDLDQMMKDIWQKTQ